MQYSLTNQLLGYAADARLLLINADDFGMCHAINEAILRTLKAGLVRSTSLMVPWPWAAHAMRLLKENTDIHFGVHLSVINDNPGYRFKPLLCPQQVPSLVDDTGSFYTLEQLATFVAQARLDELEQEFRAQIAVVLAAGLQPTHLDWHCLHDGGRADILDLTAALAQEFGLALRVADPTYTTKLQGQGLPTDDYPLLDSYSLATDGKAARYAQLLRELPAGLTEWAVHPGLDNAELQAIEPDSWQVRTTDYAFFMSAEAREIINQEGIILLDYSPLQQLWQQNRQ